MAARCDAGAPFRPEALGFGLSHVYVTFALQLSDPTWAVTTAAIVCQPVLGASLRKASFRMIGTVVGAIGIVIIAALFRQDRIGFLVGLALWCAVSAFVATLLRNFAAYAAALAGYTAAILASDVLGPVGTTDGVVTFLAINRAIEICTGILCAGVVLALTDIGHSRRKLAAELAYLSTAIMDGFADCFRIASSDFTQFQGLRRDLLRRIIALDPMIDAAIGEASDLRYRSPVLQRAVSGLVETISAWRKAAYEIALNHNRGDRTRGSRCLRRTAARPALARRIGLGENAGGVARGMLLRSAIPHPFQRRKPPRSDSWRIAQPKACSAWRGR